MGKREARWLEGLPQTFDLLIRHACDQVEALIDVQHRQPRQFSGGRYQQVWNGYGAMMASVGQQQLYGDGAGKAANHRGHE